MIFSTRLILFLFLCQLEVVNPNLATDQRVRRLTDDFKQHETRVCSRVKLRLLQAPRTGLQNIVGEDVGSFTVSIRDRETRTAGTLKCFRLAFGTKLVLGVRFHWYDLSDPHFRGIQPIEGDRKRSRAAVKLTVVNGQGGMQNWLIPPVKATV